MRILSFLFSIKSMLTIFKFLSINALSTQKYRPDSEYILLKLSFQYIVDGYFDMESL